MLIPIAACSGDNGGDISSDMSTVPETPEITEPVDTRIDIAACTVIYPASASDTLKHAVDEFISVCASEYGIELAVKDDTVTVGDGAEILVGDVARDEASEADGLSSGTWSVTAKNNKIVVAGTSEYAVRLGLAALGEALLNAERNDHGHPAVSPETLSLSGVAELNNLVVLADQRNSMVRVCDITRGVSLEDSLWTHKYTAYNIADTRLREYNGRLVVLAAYGSNMASMVSYDDAHEVLYQTLYTAKNPHACELIPCGVIAVAASDGGEIRFFNVNKNGRLFTSVKLDDSHGLLYDPELEVLWAVGTNVLTAYEVSLNDSGTVVVAEREELRATIPSGAAHDLQPYYGNSDRMWVTTTTEVFIYSKSEKRFFTDYAGNELINRIYVTGISNFDDGRVVSIAPYGSYKAWTSNIVDLFTFGNDAADKSAITSVNGDFYKVRVWNPSYN